VELNKPEKKIITVEDPVEYRLPRINQVQVHQQIGLTFASVLRTALRQDPDVVLIGEMRDQETAQIGLRAAMTGHFVLSTLHTNDAVSTANRLVDMGAEGYLVASSLRAVVAQRLIRRLCENCRQTYTPTTAEIGWLDMLDRDDSISSGVEFMHGTGCSMCNNTGYKGRIGVYELLELDAPLMDALRRDDTAGFANAAAQKTDYVPLVQVALDYAKQGVTTLEEVMRVVGEVPEESPPQVMPTTEPEAEAETEPGFSSELSLADD
jgi:MSHA biogenesis protein MshE